jgi:tRNA-specific 2-thiouridylase
MSGGVDSLRTAVLLQNQGHEVIGLHMRLLPYSTTGRWDADAAIAAREDRLHELALRLRIVLHILDLRREFEALVIEPFLAAYRAGLTPSPCVRCNPAFKFGHLRREAQALGADLIATGHYARVEPPASGSRRFRLYRSRDRQKDQSYFLYGLNQEQLRGTLFPLGELCKLDVLDWAAKAGLDVLLPAESQEICFIPNGHYREFLQERLEIAPHGLKGYIVDGTGNVLGEHDGIFCYTIGQRRGLGIASTAPYYVTDLDPATNQVRVGRAQDLCRSELAADQVNWLSIDPPREPLRALVRIRNQHQPAAASVAPLDEARVVVRFDVPQRAVTPGQAAVFYHGDLVLGGGIIARESQQID